MNSYIVEESQARYQERVDAAAQWRLAQMARAATPGLAARVRAAIGARLIVWGLRMQAQPAPVAVSQHPG